LKIKPVVNQVELHPWLTREELVAYCKSKSIEMQAYSPLVTGVKMEDSLLVELATKYGKTQAQILINWSLSKGFISLPKTVTVERLLSNFNSRKFQMSDDDIKRLDNKNENKPVNWDPTVYPY